MIRSQTVVLPDAVPPAFSRLRITVENRQDRHNRQKLFVSICKAHNNYSMQICSLLQVYVSLSKTSRCMVVMIDAHHKWFAPATPIKKGSR